MIPAPPCIRMAFSVARSAGPQDVPIGAVVVDADGRELARGLIAYGSADARRILGRQSGEIETILGYRGREEMIHRDDLVES